MRPSARLAAAVVVAGLLGSAPLRAANATAAAVPSAAPATVTAAPVRPATAAPSTASAPSGVTGKGGYLYDAAKGRKLWGRSTTTARPVGSITKVMTALVVIRAGGLDRTVTVRTSWAGHVRHNDATSAGLRAGDRVTVRQLLYGAMLPSGCDAAYGLADLYGPGQSRFVAKMNRVAASLGMAHTRFVDSDGLPTSSRTEGRSTPHDLMLLARAAMKSATFRGVVAHRTYKIAKGGGHHAYSWTNTNLLLGSYGGAIGIKTGHTDAAGYCLLFAAERNGRTLIGVLLDSTTTKPDTRFTSAARLLDWGFGARAARLTLRSLPMGAPTD